MAVCKLAFNFVFSLSLAAVQSNFYSDNMRDLVLFWCTSMLYFRQEDESNEEILEKWYKDRLLCVQLVFYKLSRIFMPSPQ